MKIITKKEIETLIKHIDNEELKNKILEVSHGEEIEIEKFFKKIKSLNMIEDTDYNLMLLLEEFYLRFKDLGWKMLEKLEKELLNIIQTDFPIEERPYKKIGEQLGISEEKSFEITKKLFDKGIIRRLGATFDSTSPW